MSKGKIQKKETFQFFLLFFAYKWQSLKHTKAKHPHVKLHNIYIHRYIYSYRYTCSFFYRKITSISTFSAYFAFWKQKNLYKKILKLCLTNKKEWQEPPVTEGMLQLKIKRKSTFNTRMNFDSFSFFHFLSLNAKPEQKNTKRKNRETIIQTLYSTR